MRLPARLGVLVAAVGVTAAFVPTVAAHAARAGHRPTPTVAVAPLEWTVGSLRAEPVAPGPSGLGVDGAADYAGALDVVRGPAGVAVVNDVGLEDYVAGISEMPASWPSEALKAQAIAARTYALAQLRDTTPTPARGVGADLCATDSCQVYAGLARARQERGGAWVAAVAATRGEVLLRDGLPIVAKYSSSNGGRSVPGGRPYLRAVDDPDDVYSPQHRWRSTIALGDAAPLLGLPAAPATVGRAGDLVVLTWLPASPTDAGHAEMTAVEFRSRLNGAPAPDGMPKLVPSLQFEPSVDLVAGLLVVDGRGWGHGIGMSQFGALGKALRGLRAADILATYYGGIRPSGAAPGLLPERVRVAVALDRRRVVITASTPTRFTDEAGRVLAVASSGPWQISPAADGRLSVRPPAEQQGAPALREIDVQPARPTPHDAVRISFRLSTPSVVRLALRRPGGGEVPVGAETLVAGISTTALPPLASAGRWNVVIRADAGGGRVADIAVPVDVAQPARVPRALPAHRPDGGPGGLATLAVLALMAVAVAVGGATPDGGSGGRPLH